MICGKGGAFLDQILQEKLVGGVCLLNWLKERRNFIKANRDMFDLTNAPFFVLSDGHLNVFYRKEEAKHYFRFSKNEGRETKTFPSDHPLVMKYSDGRMRTYTLYNKNIIQRVEDGEVVFETENNWDSWDW
jgi:hypothetical protein